MSNQPSLQEAFAAFGFSALETRVYVALLEGGKANGSELARRLVLTRASVYGTLHALAGKGAVWLIPGNPQVYEAVPYRQLVQQLRRTSSDCLEAIAEGLKHLVPHPAAEQVINFSDPDRFADEVREAFRQARHEICLTVSAEAVATFGDVIAAARRRGVRVIGFTTEAGLSGSGDEWFVRELNLESVALQERIQGVFDQRFCLTGGRDAEGRFLGVASRNPLLITVLAEHFHHDVYLARMQERLGRDPVRREFLLGSLHEKNVRCRRRNP
ncbi:MAG: TrmB family transcriptional regulator [Candidatus Riflebacteria bacterium]|nr:TrmB family transcriptional regulator [Candidatus Riflebacteria bacterium]